MYQQQLNPSQRSLYKSTVEGIMPGNGYNDGKNGDNQYKVQVNSRDPTLLQSFG